ncbi:hypothetical protein ACWDZ4_21970 [Streptomyces sp. NPDC003016]
MELFAAPGGDEGEERVVQGAVFELSVDATGDKSAVLGSVTVEDVLEELVGPAV